MQNLNKMVFHNLSAPTIAEKRQILINKLIAHQPQLLFTWISYPNILVYPKFKDLIKCRYLFDLSNDFQWVMFHTGCINDHSWDGFYEKGQDPGWWGKEEWGHTIVSRNRPIKPWMFRWQWSMHSKVINIFWNTDRKIRNEITPVP